MHPALRLEELARLPLAVRKFATAAAGGSEPDMIKLILRIMFQPTTSAQYLPPLFANLNPARFPPLELLDIPTPAPSAVRAIEANIPALAAAPHYRAHAARTLPGVAVPDAQGPSDDGADSCDAGRLFALAHMLTFLHVRMGSLQGALLPAGLVKTLTAALFPICETVLEGMEAVLFGCLEILIASLRAESAYPSLPEAIDAGHLRAIVTFGRTRNTARNRAKLEASTIFPYWLEVLGLVGQRALVLQEFESADHISVRLCDNRQCDVVKKAPKSSAVLAVASSAWRDAGHREFVGVGSTVSPPNRVHLPANATTHSCVSLSATTKPTRLASSPHNSHSPKAALPRNSAPSLITRMTRGHAYRPAKHELNQMGEFVQERAEGNNNASGSKMPGAEADNVRLMDTEVGEYGGGPERYGDESETEARARAMCDEGESQNYSGLICTTI
ncbi:hypothetical protein DFH09DRAFT_1284052 [Mycena vulgaris]|nr:hypothetical protein DFH09DRAFT_1284052 [Mycena vulgaris]